MEYNIKRIGLLLNKDFKEMLLKTIAIISLIFFVIITINLVISYFNVNSNAHNFNIYGTFIGMFMIGCTIMGSITWEEIAKRPRRIEYLSLPASTAEKLSSKFITSAILFPILMIIMFFIMRGYAEGMNSILGGRLRLDNFPDFEQYKLFNVGAILTAIFAYGSIKYNTASFPKIIVWALAFFAAFVAISFVLGFIIFPEMRHAIFGFDEPRAQIHTNDNIEDFWLIGLLKKLFYIVPLIFWGMSYFTLKEKEA